MSIDDIISNPVMLRGELVSVADFILNNVGEKLYDKNIEGVLNPKLFYLNELLLSLNDEIVNGLFNVVSKEFNQDYSQFKLINDLLMPFYDDSGNYYGITCRALMLKSLLEPVIINDDEINDFKNSVAEIISNTELQPHNLSEDDLLFINSRLKRIISYTYSIVFNNDNKRHYGLINNWTHIIEGFHQLFRKTDLDYNTIFNNLIRLDLFLNDDDGLNELVNNPSSLRRELLSISDFIISNLGEPSDFSVDKEKLINQRIINLKRIIYKLDAVSLNGLSIASKNSFNNLKLLYILQFPFYGTKSKSFSFNNYSRLLIDNLAVKSLLNPREINDDFINEFRSVVDKSLNTFLSINPYEMRDPENQVLVNSRLKEFMSYISLIKFNNLFNDFYTKVTGRTGRNNKFVNLIDSSLQQLIGDDGHYSNWVSVLMSVKYFLDNKLFNDVDKGESQMYI